MKSIQTKIIIMITVIMLLATGTLTATAMKGAEVCWILIRIR